MGCDLNGGITHAYMSFSGPKNSRNAALLGLTNVSAHMGIDRTTMWPGKDYRLNVFALPGQCPWTIYIISPGVVVGFCVSTQ